MVHLPGPMLTRRMRPPTIANQIDVNKNVIGYNANTYTTFGRSHTYVEGFSMADAVSKEMDLLEEIPRGVSTPDAPPVVDEHVEDRKSDDKESCRPLCLETDCNHYASRETNKRNEETRE